MNKKWIATGLALWLFAFGSAVATAQAAQFDYGHYEKVLDLYAKPGVALDGVVVTAVDYNALSAAAKKQGSDYALLLQALAQFNPETLENREEKMAFWINVYNIAAIKMIIDHYPVDSIRSWTINWLGLPWSVKIITVGGKAYSLGQIENDILLDTYRDLRIHFAINCASIGCVNLAVKPYRGATLSRQLDEQAKMFLADTRKGLRLDRENKTLFLSQVFKFDKNRFDQFNGGVLGFLSPYLSPQDRLFLQSERVGIEYLDYNWKTNDFKNRK